MPASSWQSNIHIQAAAAVIPDEEKPSTAQQAVTSSTTSPALRQDNDISWTWQWNKGRLNHTAQLVPIMPPVSGEHIKESAGQWRGQFYMHSQGDTKAGRSADLYFEVKLVNGVRGSVLNQEIHSAAWSVVFLLPGVPGPVLPQRTFSCKEKKPLFCFLTRSVAVTAHP